MYVVVLALLVAVIFLALCIPAAAVVGFRAGLYRANLMGQEDWRRSMGLAMLITGSDRSELLDTMDGIEVPSTSELLMGDKESTSEEHPPPPIRRASRGHAFGISPGQEMET